MLGFSNGNKSTYISNKDEITPIFKLRFQIYGRNVFLSIDSYIAAINMNSWTKLYMHVKVAAKIKSTKKCPNGVKSVRGIQKGIKSAKGLLALVCITCSLMRLGMRFRKRALRLISRCKAIQSLR